MEVQQTGSNAWCFRNTCTSMTRRIGIRRAGYEPGEFMSKGAQSMSNVRTRRICTRRATYEQRRSRETAYRLPASEGRVPYQGESTAAHEDGLSTHLALYIVETTYRRPPSKTMVVKVERQCIDLRRARFWKRKRKRTYSKLEDKQTYYLGDIRQAMAADDISGYTSRSARLRE